MSRVPELPLAGLIWNEQRSSAEDARRNLQAMAKGALKLARQSGQPDEKRAFEELAAGALRLARR